MAKEETKVESADKAKAREALKVARRAARQRVLKFLSENANELGDMVKDIRMFVGGGGVRKASTSNVNIAIRSAFLEAQKAGKGLTEMDLFKAFKVGRPEMVTKTRILVLCKDPADRVWVKFDEAKETYFVVGLGANPPKDWDGYVPSEKAQL